MTTEHPITYASGYHQSRRFAADKKKSWSSDAEVRTNEGCREDARPIGPDRFASRSDVGR
jgi:hypothetical protein